MFKECSEFVTDIGVSNKKKKYTTVLLATDRLVHGACVFSLRYYCGFFSFTLQDPSLENDSTRYCEDCVCVFILYVVVHNAIVPGRLHRSMPWPV